MFVTTDSISGVFFDAIVCDDRSRLLFLSAWGSETSIKSIQSMLSLSKQEGGIASFYYRSRFTSGYVSVLDKPQYIATTERVSQTTYQSLVHCFVYDRCFVQSDVGQHHAYLLACNEADNLNVDRQHCWQKVKKLCSVPLLDNWQDTVLDVFMDKAWITGHDGFAVRAWEINLPMEAVEQTIQALLKSGQLTVPEDNKQGSDVTLLH